MKFASLTFLIAGIYGVIVLLPQYFLEQKNGRDFPPPVNHPEYFYGFIGVALAWQIAFLIIARNPRQYRLLMIPATLEKASFGAAVIWLFLLGRVSAFIVGFAAVDLILGMLFIVSYIKTSGK